MADYLAGLARLPDYMRDGMQQWIEHGFRPGGFMTAVLQNDLMDAFARADSVNQLRMRDYVMFLHNDAPSQCFGSVAKFNAWQAAGGLAGKSQPAAE